MLAAADPDLFLKVTSFVTVSTFAALALAGNRRRATNVLLAAFLVLIAANQGAEIARGWIVTSDAARLRWWHAATIAASLDPFFLYAFAAIWPVKNRLARPLPLALVGAVSLALVVTTPFVRPDWELALAGRVHADVRVVFSILTYLVVTRHFLARVLDPAGPRTHALYYGACLATIPLAASAAMVPLKIATRYGAAPTTLVESGAQIAAQIAIVLLLVVALRTVPGAVTKDAARVRARGLAFGAALTAVIMLPQFGTLAHLAFGWFEAANSLVMFGRAGAALRWEAFSLLAATTLIREDALGASFTTRRRAARVLVAAAVVAAVGVLVFGTARAMGVADASRGAFPFEVGLVIAAVVFSQAFRSLVDRIAERAYGVPREGDLGARLAAYRRAVEQTVAEGRAPHADAVLARVRRELTIDAASAAVIEDVVQDAADQRPLAVGRRVSGCYRVERLLARGGNGRVHLARDETTGAAVVLKEVPRDEHGLADAALTEARIAGSLAHAHVARLIDVVERPGSIVLVTEYVSGGALDEHVHAHGPLDVRTGLRVLDDVLSALAAAHAAGVVHRDVKPANVLLTRDPLTDPADPSRAAARSGLLRAKLTDFGTARVDAGVTLTADAFDEFAGSWAFMAPEQKRGERASPASDVHAVGLLARDCVRAPLPPAVDAVIARALEEDPARRWRDAGEMRRALADATGAITGGTGEASAPRRSRHPS